MEFESHMLRMYVNGSFPKRRLRETLYDGAIWLNTQTASAPKLCDLADRFAVEHLGPDPRNAHKRMDVQEFTKKVSALKHGFTNCEESKLLIRDFIREIDQDPADFLFDVPRLRVVPNYDYLHAGVSYAYKPHRDLWYGGPACQLNTWMTVYPIEPSETMMINPAYFDQPVKNSSAGWDLKDWIENQRGKATSNVASEERPHPVPLEDIDDAGEIRVAGERAEMLIFSGAHLHGTVPNHGDLIRFSVDFRLFHIADLRAGQGARNVDSGARNVEYGYKDYYSASELSPYGEAGA
jgi:hypothetical protein